MNLRRTLIQLSIKKQIYFSIFGLGLFICINVFLLILVLIVTLLNNKKSKMINTLEDKDNMLIELTGQYEVMLGEIFLIQTKNEILFHRIFNKILKEEYENLTKKLTKNRFNDNCSENKKYGCLQIYDNNSDSDEIEKQSLFLALPLLKLSFKSNLYNKERISIYENFHYFNNKKRLYILYNSNNKNNTDEKIEEKFNDYITNLNEKLNNDIKNYIKKLNNINENLTTKEENYYNLTLYNPNNIFSADGKSYDPSTDKFPRIHTGSFFFEDETKNLIDYMSLDWKVDILNTMSLYMLENIKGIYTLIGAYNYTFSTNVCKLVFKLSNIYLDKKKEQKNLNISKPFYLFNECFPYDETINKINEYINENVNYTNNVKIRTLFGKTSYKNNINNENNIKIFQMHSHNEYLKFLINSPYFETIAFHYFLVKLCNDLIIEKGLIEDYYNNILIVLIFIIIFIWVIVFLIISLRISVVANKISKPIQELIQSISYISDNDINLNKKQKKLDKNFDRINKIYFKEDKDIDEFLKVCQKLISNFNLKKEIIRQNTLNVYNNITYVKSNNYIINEENLEIKKDENLKKIFGEDEDDKKIKKSNLIVNKELLKKENNYIKEMKNIIENKKKYLNNYHKQLFSKAKKDEYKFFIIANNELKDHFETNSLYKLYNDEFCKNKKNLINN